jgi:hypothetical protein
MGGRGKLKVIVADLKSGSGAFFASALVCVAAYMSVLLTL